MEIFEIPFAAECVDLLAYGVRHLAESGIEDVDNRLAGGLDDAFFEAFLTAFEEAFLDTFLETFLEAFFKAFFKAFHETFLAAFFKGEFFEEGDVGHSFVGEALLELFSELELKVVGQGYQPVDQVMQ